MKKYYLLLLTVIFVSGCTGLGGIFGGDVLNIQQNIIQGSPDDVLVVNNVQVIPSSSILPNQDVTITFNLENKDNIRKTTNIIVDLFNAPSFRMPPTDGSDKGPLCNAVGCLPDKCSKSMPCPYILPGEQKQITFEIKSPTQGDIAGIKTDVSLDYKVDYDYDSAFVYVVPVVNLEEIISRQRAGEKTTIEFTKSYSSGPLRIDAELIGAPYILSGQDAAISFKIQNKGSSTVWNSTIVKTTDIRATALHNAITQAGDFLSSLGSISVQGGSKGIVIIFPPELRPIDKGWPDNFNCMQLQLTGETLCYNTEDVQMFKDETRTSMRFAVKTSLPAETPFRSYTIKAFVGYTYELRNSIKVTVNSYQNT